MKINEIARKNILALQPYSTARDECQMEIGTYLDANENPYNNGHNRYPDPHQRLLKSRIAEIKEIDTNNLFIGNGSDEAIDIIIRIFCEPNIDEIIAIAPSYGMYKVCAEINSAKLIEAQLNSDYSINIKTIKNNITDKTKLIFLCSPNNPTGNLLDKNKVIKLIESFNGVVVIDEAYIDFANDEGFRKMVNEYPNIVVLQTMSKAWGMAGLRVGMAISSPEIIELMNRVKYPYNINHLAQEKVLELLSDKGVEKYKIEVNEIISEREKLIQELKDIDCIKEVFDTDANFILVKVENAKGIYNKLIGNKIIVRNRSSLQLCDNTLRITVGTPQENKELISELKI